MRKMPIEGNVENMLERLCQYIQPVDPIWREKICPANEADINTLLKISQIGKINFSLPEEYLCYLKTMGQNDGGLVSWLLHAKTDIKTLLRLYNEKIGDISDPVEPNHLIIAYNDEVGLEYYINILDEHQYNISTEESLDMELEDLSKVSENFEKLLFQSAVRKYEEKYMIFSEYFGNNRIEYIDALKQLGLENIFISVEKIAQNYNCNKMWFSDKWNYFASNQELSFWIKKDYALSGAVFGNNVETVKSILNDLKEICGVTKY